MRSLLVNTLFAGALLGVCASTTGCLEETTNVEVQSDGSGKLTFERKVGKQLASFMLMAPDGPQKAAAEAMAKFDGMDCWTDVEAKATDDGRLAIKATGWFSDLSKVKQVSDQSGTTYVFKSEGGTVEIGIDQEQSEDEGAAEGMGGGMGGAQQKSLFDYPPEQLPMVKQMTKGMMSGMMAGFKTEVNFKLPSDASDITGFKAAEGDAKSIGMAFTGEDLAGVIDMMFDEAEKLRPQVDSGELTKEDADKKLKEIVEEKTMKKFGPFRAKFAVADPVRDPAFNEAFEAAKTAWATSEWKAAIEQAKAEEAAGGDNPFGDPGEGGGEEPEDGDKDDDREF